jgi:hypothetical protein
VDRTRVRESGGKAIRPDRSAQSQARQLHREIVELRGQVLRGGGEIFDRWRPRIRREEFLPSARNLAHYLALRRHDLRDLQVRLMPWGQTSLGRCEARVLPSLNAVAAALAALGSEGGPEAEPDTEAFFRGHESLSANTEAVLGPIPPNQIIVHVAPVLLGGGVRLFERFGGEPVRLEWISSVNEGETTVLRYSVGKGGAEEQG